jgi:hypothetical protein
MRLDSGWFLGYITTPYQLLKLCRPNEWAINSMWIGRGSRCVQFGASIPTLSSGKWGKLPTGQGFDTFQMRVKRFSTELTARLTKLHQFTKLCSLSGILVLLQRRIICTKTTIKVCEDMASWTLHLWVRVHFIVEREWQKLGPFYCGKRMTKNEVKTRPHKSVCLQIADSNVTDQCFDNKLQQMIEMLSLCFHTAHSASH